MRKAIIIILKYVVCFVLVAIFASVAFFGLNYYVKSNRDNGDLGKTQTEFYANADGTRIENVPFDDYISSESAPTCAVVPDIKENADGEYNAERINSAIEALSLNGTIYIPHGVYKISTIKLKSDMTFFVSSGAKLVSLDSDENEKSSVPLSQAVILADGIQNVVICGGGTIAGSGASYTLEPEETEPLYALKEFNLYTRVIESRKRIRFAKDTVRANLVRINDSKNITIKNIVLEESAEWTLVINKSSDVDISNIVIDNNFRVANSDGIDVCGSSNIRISHSFIATGDDAIVLKSSIGEIKNVVIEDCVLSSFANCFKIGTETAFDISNVSVRNSKFFLPDGMTGGYAGIAIESADGANVSDIKIENISMDGISSPILIWLGNRLSYDRKTVGSIRNVDISNITAINTELPSAITGCRVNGKIYAVENVTLSKISAVYRDTAENLTIRHNVGDSSMDGYPEITRVSHVYFLSHELSTYWDLPCYALFVRYSPDLDYSDYTASPRSCSTLPAFCVLDA